MAPLTLALAGARLRVARGRQLAVVAALGVAAVIPVVVAASAAVTADAALERALGSLPSGERSVIVSYNGLLDDAESAQADATVRQRLGGLGAQPVRRQLEFRPLADRGGDTFVLAAADGLADTVRLTDGRLPRSCTPSRCEVVVENPPGGSDPVLGDVGLVVVGHVTRTDPLLLSGTFEPDETLPLVLADGVQQAAAIEPLALIQRSYGWVAPLSAAVVSARGVDEWSRAATAVADRLSLDLIGLQLVTPDSTLRSESDRAQESAGRFGLLAGSCAALLLGAALVGGAALRPDHGRFVTALRRRGLGAGRIQTVLGLETFALAIAGLVAGLAAGCGVAAVMAARAGLPAGSTALAAVLTSLPGVLALSAAAWALLVLSLWPGAGGTGYAEQRARWRAVTAGAVAGVVAVLLVVSRGSSGSTSSSASSDPLVVVLPALVLVTLGLITARLWPMVLQLAHRILPRRAPGLRLGISGISARPMLAASTVALLAAGVGASGFAASYRSTLLRGAQDQAAFAVPFDARIQPGTALLPVLARASAGDYAAVAPGATAMPVLRQVASIRSGPRSAEGVQMVGLDPRLMPSIQRWPRVVGGPGPAAVGAELAGPVSAPGLRLPSGQQLEIRIGDELPDVVLTANLRADDGTERTVTLEPAAASGVSALEAVLPALPRGSEAWFLGAISVQQSTEDATRRGHGQGEGETTRADPSGRIDLDAVDVDATPVSAPWSGWTGDGLEPSPDGATARLDYRLTAGVLVLSAVPAPIGTAASGRPVPVAADPATAAQGPLITLTLGDRPVQATVVATLPRMPTVSGRFVVLERSALAAIVDAGEPGQGQPGEIWLALPAGASSDGARDALSGGAFTGVGGQWRADIERTLRTDPIAVGAVGLLLLAAGLTMLVALAALVLLVASERFEDAGELYTWEASGVPPAVLRRGLWARAALVAVAGVPIGVVGGLVLTRLTARLVGLTAGAAQPQPPLVAVTGLGTALPIVVVALALALLAAGAVAATALREPRPVLPTGRGGGSG